jgi:dihydroorotase
MNLVFRQATVIDPDAVYDGQVMDIHILDGRIAAIGPGLSVSGALELDMQGAWCCPGWLDFAVQGGDPGLEHREDAYSLSEAALSGGYTALVCNPNTLPAVHSKSEVAYLRSKGLPVDIYPIGAASVDCAGKDIAEMLDMHRAGAVAFGDGLHAIQHGGLMMRALLYVTAFDGIIVNRPYDQHIAGGGYMHEGAVSTQLGLRGIPSLAETLMLERDIHLLRYTGSRLHINGISCADAVAKIRQAKLEGLRVSASVGAMNLLFTDEQLLGFDEQYKVLPPLREEEDRQALIGGLLDGTIDFIFSNHVPQDPESKNREFTYADFGALGLQTAAAALWTALQGTITPHQFVQWLSLQARAIFGLPRPNIAVGERAVLSFFDPDCRWTFRRTAIVSKSTNTPFLDHTFTGRVKAVVNGTQYRCSPDL